jgi:Tol biopolymer transport system component
MPDSMTTILVSNRTGHTMLYRQAVDEDTLEPLVTEGYGRNPRVTPDGRNIIYLGLTETGTHSGGPQPVLRASLTGGLPQLLFTARPNSLLTCARPPSALCVIAEPTDDRHDLVLTAVDPFTGRGGEVAHFTLDPTDDRWFIDLSPDGARIAAIRSPAGPIYLLSLHGRPTQEIHVDGLNNLSEFLWAADGKSLFVTAGVRNGRVISNVDLRGNARVLWKTPQDAGEEVSEALAIPSPDGRHLALQAWTTSGNMWMMENF